MKVKVTKANGEVWELEGTGEEIARVLAPQTAQLTAPPISIPSVWADPSNICLMGGFHEFESPWLGIFPPPCKKCGQAQPFQPTWTVTCESLDFQPTWTVTCESLDSNVATQTVSCSCLGAGNT